MAYPLESDATIDGVNWKAGTLVAKARHTNVWHAKEPNARPRAYIPNPATVRVPLELVLHSNFPMVPASMGNLKGDRAKRMKAAIGKGAVVLSEDDHEVIMEELHARDMGEDEE